MVIGCGAGVTAGAVSIDPAVEHETIAEIEPLVPRVGLDLFRRAQLRRRAATRRSTCTSTMRGTSCSRRSEKFDAITSDPLDPWVKGAAMLYTREFFELAKARLNPGGIVTLFVQLYESNTEAVKSEIATFFEAFPERDDLRQHLQRRGLRPGAARPGRRRRTINLDEMEARLQRPEYEPVRKSLARHRDELCDRPVRHLCRRRRRTCSRG